MHNRCKLGKNIKNDPNGIGDPGTDIDDPDFGIWLDVHEHRSGANAYNKKWEEFFGRFSSIGDISINDIAEFLGSLDKLW